MFREILLLIHCFSLGQNIHLDHVDCRNLILSRLLVFVSVPYPTYLSFLPALRTCRAHFFHWKVTPSMTLTKKLLKCNFGCNLCYYLRGFYRKTFTNLRKRFTVYLVLPSFTTLSQQYFCTTHYRLEDLFGYIFACTSRVIHMTRIHPTATNMVPQTQYGTETNDVFLRKNYTPTNI